MYRALTLIVALLLTSPVALAQETGGDDGDQSSDKNSRLGHLVIGAHVGPNMQFGISPLQVHAHPRVELGGNLPFLGRRIQAFLTAAYTLPPARGTVADERLPNSGEFSFHVVQHELMLGIGIHGRIFELGTTLNPYLGAGPQLFLLKTVVNGEAAGEPFGENIEVDRKWGVYAAAGLEWALGPGALFFQVSFTWSKLDRRITGESSTGAYTPSIGYRIMVL
jgi:hypothetical protein